MQPHKLYSVAYEATRSNLVSDFRDFVCSLFQEPVTFYLFFILIHTNSFTVHNFLCNSSSIGCLVVIRMKFYTLFLFRDIKPLNTVFR